MYSKFKSISKEKQERILNSALEEFSKRGYKLASTNTIVENAGISKGLLFHYFQNKKMLFLYLYNHFVDIVVTKMYDTLDYSQTDLFKRLEQLMYYKMDIIRQFPMIFKFLEVAYLENTAEINSDITDKNHQLIEESKKIFNHIDYSKFKPDFDIKKMINIILWTIEGLGNQIYREAKNNQKVIDYEKTFGETSAYLLTLKKLFYKEEELS